MVAQPINSPNLGPDRNRIQTSDHTKTKSFQVNQTTQTNQANQPKVAPPTTTTEKANIPCILFSFSDFFFDRIF
jgi:hypothetical protein